jgi:hypothetical protein
MKKCPPGVICVENITMVLLVIIVLILGFLIYANSSKNINNIQIDNDKESSGGWFQRLIPSWPYNNLPKDVLLNPYDAPYRDERYFINSAIPINAVPINVATNIGSVPANTSYRQMGIITPLNGESKDNILPLMGKPLLTNRDKWQYYTISNQHNNVKLPISFKGRSALNDYGVDQIFSGDTVYVEGYNDAFRVTVYENDTIKYLPFL